MLGAESQLSINRRITGPHISTKAEVSRMSDLLSHAYAMGKSRVYTYGMFPVYERLGKRAYSEHLLWSPESLLLDQRAPGQFGVRIPRDGTVHFISGDEEVVAQAQNVRKIIDTGRNMVLSTGYLIPGSEYRERYYVSLDFMGNQRIVEIEYLESLLRDAEQGIKPPGYSRQMFIKLDYPGMFYPGETVTRLEITSLVDPRQIIDFVLVKKGKIIPGRITYPLTKSAVSRRARERIA